MHSLGLGARPARLLLWSPAINAHTMLPTRCLSPWVQECGWVRVVACHCFYCQCRHCSLATVMSVETKTSTCFKSAEMPQAHNLINVWKFSPCCLCLNLSHGASGKGALCLFPVSKDSATRKCYWWIRACLFGAKEPSNAILILAECLFYSWLCLIAFNFLHE